MPSSELALPGVPAALVGAGRPGLRALALAGLLHGGVLAGALLASGGGDQPPSPVPGQRVLFVDLVTAATAPGPAAPDPASARPVKPRPAPVVGDPETRAEPVATPVPAAGPVPVRRHVPVAEREATPEPEPMPVAARKPDPPPAPDPSAAPLPPPEPAADTVSRPAPERVVAARREAAPATTAERNTAQVAGARSRVSVAGPSFADAATGRTPAPDAPARGGADIRTGAGPAADPASAPRFPAYLRNPAPEYPRSARRKRQEGRVVLLVRVSAEGRAIDVAVESSSGHAALDTAAVRSVRRWRFIPGRSGGVPVVAEVRVPIRFVLDRS